MVEPVKTNYELIINSRTKQLHCGSTRTMTDNSAPLFSQEQWQVIHDRLELPARQREVIQHLFDGLSDKQIAERIGIALPTVRSHLRRMYTRFEVQDRTELVLFFVRELLHESGLTG